MITINRLTTRDLFSYYSLDLCLENRGLVLINGDNGAGKSSIFESLLWTLYGDTSKKLRADDVIRESSGKPITGETVGYVSADINGQALEVWRHRKHSKFNNKLILRLDGNDLVRDTDANTQQVLNEVLGSDRDAFCSAVLFPQGGAGFVGLTDKEQKSILEKVFRTERFGKALDKIREQLKQLRTERLEISAKYSEVVKQEENYSAELRALDAEQNKWALEHAKKLKQLEHNIQIAESSRPVIDQALEDWLLDYSSRNEEETFNAALKNIEGLQEERLTFQSRKAVLEESLKIVEKQIEDSRWKLTDPVPDRPKNFYNVEDVERNLYALRGEISGCDREIKIKMEEVARTHATLSKFDGKCPVCGKELNEDEEHRVVGDSRERQGKIEQELVGLRENLRAYKEKEVKLQRDIEGVKSYHSWCAFNTLTASRAEKKTELKDINIALDAVEKEYEAARQEYNQYVQARKLFVEKQKEFQIQQQKIIEHDSVVNDLKTQMKSLKSQVCPFNEQLEQLRNKGQGLKYRASVMKQNLDHHDSRISVKEFWDKGFGPSGLQSLYFSHLLPALSETTNEYLKILSDGKIRVKFSSQTTLNSGELRDRIDCAVSLLEGASSYHQSSGGEKRRIDLAAMLALSEVAAARTEQAIALRLLDEPFDDLDADGSERVVRALYERVVPISQTVLVMSHSDSLKNLISNRINVDKIMGVSRITEN